MLTDEEKAYKLQFSEMVEFVKSCGVSVNTSTKARGHQGFFLKNRIDISSKLPYKRKIEVLIHEFSHFIHSKIDSSVLKNRGNLESLFPKADISRVEKELLSVTRFVDENKTIAKLEEQRENVLCEIKKISGSIKEKYPDFKRSCPYKIFEKRIRACDAKYLLKYDRVKVKALIPSQTKLYSIDTISNDFPDLDIYETKYIVLKSKQRLLRRVSSRINKLTNYYKKPTELFARFVEGLFIDTHKVSELAPHSYLVFCTELANNRYLELADLINNFF